MKNQRTYTIWATIIAAIAIAGVVAAYFLSRANTNSDNSMEGMDHSQMNMTETSNNESATYKKYAALKGEAYDKAFLADMVVHHDSALNMAEMANAVALHQEIKDLSANIASTQGLEIGKMNDLQEKYGYQKTSGHMMTGGDMSAMEGMAMMSDELEGLTGDAFDKKFLELMIVHHQDALEMAKPAASNASRQEIKDLAQTIMTAQTKEISQMQIWQKEWGYKS